MMRERRSTSLDVDMFKDQHSVIIVSGSKKGPQWLLNNQVTLEDRNKNNYPLKKPSINFKKALISLDQKKRNAVSVGRNKDILKLDQIGSKDYFIAESTI